MSDALTRLRAADPLRAELPPALARPPRPAPAPAARPRRTLVLANLALVAAVALHGIDHSVVQEVGLGALTPEVLGGGVAMGVASVLSLALAVLAHRLAPVVATATGVAIAAAVVVSHLLPRWSDLSANYEQLGVGAVSYAIVGLLVVVGMATSAVGLRAR